MDVQFNNVTITVDDETPADAYQHLCAVLDEAGFSLETDTFQTEDGSEYDTSRLFRIR